MAITYYVRSSDGSNSDSGLTWALAKASLSGATAIDAFGDTIFVSDAHSESSATSLSFGTAGTLASPVSIICGDDAAQPPTAVAITGVVETTTNSAVSFSGVYYCYGLRFNIGIGSSSATPTFNGASVAGSFSSLEKCIIDIRTTSASGRINMTHGASIDGTKAYWKNVDIKFAATGQRLLVAGDCVWEGGSVLSGSSAVAALVVASATRGGSLAVTGVDLSNLGASLDLIDATNSSQGVKIVFRDCKLPSAWAGDMFNSTPALLGLRGEMYNCAAGDTNYALWIEDTSGSIRHETTIVRTGGASDGVTPISWKMTARSSANYPTHVLKTPEMAIWNSTTGGSKTVTAEIVHDSQGSGSGSKFTNAECWLEVVYLGTSGFPLSSIGADDVRGDNSGNILATAANQTDSSETWTTTGLTSPVKQKLAVTFTPQEAGYYLARVCLAKASAVAYVDPKLTVA
jgi:hypothetical protein